MARNTARFPRNEVQEEKKATDQAAVLQVAQIPIAIFL